MKTGIAYLRIELPDQKEAVPELIKAIRNFAESKKINITSTYIEEFSTNETSSAFDKMLKELPLSGSKAVIVKSLHHITKSNMVNLMDKINLILQKKQDILSMVDGIEINDDNFEFISKAFILFNSLNSKIKKEKINTGLWRKKQSTKDGKVHKGKGGNNYRKTDKDEIVLSLRKKGFTLQQVADDQKISVGRVRNILSATEKPTDTRWLHFNDFKGTTKMK